MWDERIREYNGDLREEGEEPGDKLIWDSKGDAKCLALELERTQVYCLKA